MPTAATPEGQSNKPRKPRYGAAWTVAIVVSAIALAGASPASAASLSQASPTGSGTACSYGSPCSIQTAFSQANGGLSGGVDLAPGDYGSSAAPIAALAVSHPGLLIRGAVGSRPRIFVDGGVFVGGAGSQVTDLEVEDSRSSGGVNAALTINGTAARVVINASGIDRGCELDGPGGLTDSVCRAAGTNTPAVIARDTGGAAFTANVRNVDALSTGANGVALLAQSLGSSGLGVTISARSVIARASGTGSRDVQASQSAGPVRVDIDHSNYSTTLEQGGGTVGEDLASKQTAAPLFASAGDYHQDPSSPTVDAGVSDANSGFEDLDTDARVIGPAADIGADELAITPVATTGAAVASGTTATANGTVASRGSTTSYFFQFGLSTAYGHHTTEGFVDSLVPPRAVSQTLSGLLPGRRYHYRLVAGNSAGFSYGADRTFVTPGSSSTDTGGGPPPPPVKPQLTGLTVSPRAFRAARHGSSLARRTGTRLSFHLDREASVRFRIERAFPGRRSGRRCLAPRPALRHRARCVRYKRLRGSFSAHGTAGRNRLRFTGRLRGHALRPGRYRLVAVPANSAGNGPRVRAKLRIRR